jgi:hypothetical protein
MLKARVSQNKEKIRAYAGYKNKNLSGFESRTKPAYLLVTLAEYAQHRLSVTAASAQTALAWY